MNYYSDIEVIKIIKVQKLWRNKKIKKRIWYFSNLPDDIWKIILYFINVKYYHKYFDNVINNRIITIDYTPYCFFNNDFITKVFQTFYLIRNYYTYLSNSTLKSSLDLAYKFVFHRRLLLIENYTINSFIEFILTNNIVNF